ncbi:hypothetical protein ACSBR1_020048 [Camellia fascicularis]
MGFLGFSWCSAIAVLGWLLNAVVFCNGGTTSAFVRPVEKSVDMPLDSDVFLAPRGYNAPQQSNVFGSLIWETGSRTVLYWSENSKKKNKAEGIVGRYKFYNYTSGHIHHCTIKNLEFDTKYYYEVGIGRTARTFWFATPPEVGPDVPYTFGLIAPFIQAKEALVPLLLDLLMNRCESDFLWNMVNYSLVLDG